MEVHYQCLHAFVNMVNCVKTWLTYFTFNLHLSNNLRY